MQLPAVQTKFLDLPNSFSLRNGATLDKVCVAYEQYGTLTPEKDNAILLFHALSNTVKNISFAFVMTVQCPFCHIKFSCYLAD